MPDATPLEKMRAFVASYPDADILSTLQIDYTDQVPEMAGIFPQGLVRQVGAPTYSATRLWAISSTSRSIPC